MCRSSAHGMCGLCRRSEAVNLDAAWLIDGLRMLIPLWLSLSVHEWAHARTAFQLGDDTAAMLGRMTLNPLAHIDPIGTFLLPLMHVPFGWAKPVPVQPHRFRAGVNMRTGMMITAIAGPIANLCLVALCMLLWVVLARFWPAVIAAEGHGVRELLRILIILNVILASFNLLPIPPLDGSRVADALMPRHLRPAWENFCQLGPFALIAVLVLPRIVGVDLFRWPLEAAEWALHWLMILFGSR